MQHLLTALLLALCVTLSATAQITATVGGIDYEINNDAITCSVTGIDATSEHIIIPEAVTISGCTYSVTVIVKQALSLFHTYTIKSICIPASVTTIEEGALNCHNGLTFIDVVSDNPAYCSVDGVLYTKDKKILHTYPRKKEGHYNIPVGVTSIGDYAFSGCALTGISIPSSVTAIGDYAFSGCAITSINIPGSVTVIGDNAFCLCEALTGINVAGNNPTYCSVGGVLYTKDMKTLLLYPLKRDGSINIPDGVTTIGDNAFFLNLDLATIDLPNSVTTIGESAFFFCAALESINIPDGTTKIRDYAFCGCRALPSICLPSSVTNIGDYAFSNCKALTGINIPNSVTAIGKGAFHNCIALESINIPNGIITIGDSVFSNCESLTSISLPSSVTTIGENAFSGCGALTRIDIPSSVTAIGSSAFGNCESLTSIDVATANPAYCSMDGVLFSKGKQILVQCPGARQDNYTVPNSVITIGDNAFSGCGALASIIIPDGVTTIGDSAFDNCESLTSINIPDGVTTIGDYAFFSCDALTSLNLPNSVTTIGDNAFCSCESLTCINIHAKLPPATSNDPDFPEGVTIHVPQGVAKAYRAAEYWKDCTIVDDL